MWEQRVARWGALALSCDMQLSSLPPPSPPALISQLGDLGGGGMGDLAEMEDWEAEMRALQDAL